MKLVTFIKKSDASSQYIGVLVDNGQNIAVLQVGVEAMEGSPSPFFVHMLAFLQGNTAARDKAQAVLEYIISQRPHGSIVASDTVLLLAPLPRPESIRDYMGFEQHIINCIRVAGLKKLAPFDEWIEKNFGRKRSMAYRLNKAWYERPIYYKGNRFSVVGPDAPVSIPTYTEKLDYELEWGIFIGKSGVNIPEEQAYDHIGGYTIFNDFSARDIQGQEMGGRLGPTKGKDFDTGNAMGPCLVTPDEIPDPYNLTMTARVNGQEWSRGTSADTSWRFEEIIAYVSKSETLYPGEFFGSGTCSGVQGRGCGLEMGKFLKAGDVVELEVENIGILRNRVEG
uniref:Fumarylacetoacetate (FAA) hydrolase family protein n=1 Tax=Candidatus Kentrum sp. TUN TaxID=2126343 RepID=A0A450ZS43_9GAMM|nr:MAG: Fumarylacetoacetate (FAA) hydrolase family protein [Candidatus Kentron sp. TUN]VFK51735.1 MAG: Fumarylacetoacetate (FAA) hydrolase family protein [Candidatus Kentron sp. TUN]VFK56596.1 MAG: Fumarylacetoacetate (FAA) hydrolase family protein [Candidatus Kentron sp. TUN]